MGRTTTAAARPAIALVIAAAAMLAALTLTLARPAAADPAAQGVITDETSAAQAVPWGDRSYWAQPWRTYMNTVPATTLRSAIGINFDVTTRQAAGTAQLLGDEGFRRARLEVGWNSLSYSDPSQLTPTALVALRTKLLALQANGIRPLILLNANAQQPTPVQPGTLTLTAPAQAGATSLSVDPSSLAAIAIGRTGISSDGVAAHTLITAVDPATDTVTLSRPLDAALPAGPVSDVTLLDEPFAPPADDGAADPRFTQTLQGWLSYVAVVTQTAKSILGDDDFDVEVWNELGFGSQFLSLDNYYSPVPWTEPSTSASDARSAILEATIGYLRNPANGLTDVGIGDGFADQTPYASGSDSPPGLTAIDKHPYAGLKVLPQDAPDNGNRPLDALGDPSGTKATGPGGGQIWQDTFTPTYDSFFPEYWLTASYQTETLIHDLSPTQTYFGGSWHGAGTAPAGGSPPQMWVTEVNTNPAQGPIPLSQLSAADVAHIQAKVALRYFTSFVDKGVTALYLYGASAGAMSVVSSDFLGDLTQSAAYPGDATGGEITTAVGRLARDLSPATTITDPRRLSLQTLTDYSGGIQFHGNGTAQFPDLYYRDELAFLPFQDSNDSFTVATYVMTRDVEQDYDPSNTAPTRFDLPAQSYAMTIGGVDGASATVSATNPLTGDVVPVQIVSRGVSTITVQLGVTDSPELLNISDDGAVGGAAGGATGAGTVTTGASGSGTTGSAAPTATASSAPRGSTTSTHRHAATAASGAGRSETGRSETGRSGAAGSPAPALTALALSRRAFTTGATRAHARHAAGTEIRYRVTSAGALLFTVLRSTAARRGACPRGTSRLGGRCRAAVASFRRPVAAGSGTLAFSGRVARRTLAPGRYVLRAAPRADGALGNVVTVGFTITRR